MEQLIHSAAWGQGATYWFSVGSEFKVIIKSVLCTSQGSNKTDKMMCMKIPVTCRAV